MNQFSPSLWQPLWNFDHEIRNLPPGNMPYSLEDSVFINWLKEFKFGMQICFPVFRNDELSTRIFWREIAAIIGNDFKINKDFWESLGVSDDFLKRTYLIDFDEPYYGSLDLATWQALREIFGIPKEGILYADYTDPLEVKGAIATHSINGYKYFSGTCFGETQEEIFSVDAGTSCCWSPDNWLVSVDQGLSRGIVCFNEKKYVDALKTRSDLEWYQLWSPDSDFTL